MLNQLFQHKLLENRLEAVPEVKRFLESIITYFALIYIVYTIIPCFQFSPDLSWIIELTSYALRNILWLTLPILLFPEKKELWLIMIAAILNIPSGISDILFVDEYDNLFIFLKLLFLIAALYLTIKHIIKMR
jgi:hypothetical protein